MTEEEAQAAALALIPSGPVMTLGELESHLGRATDILRGSIDQADFKAYIFPLMFFKRINDVYLEEYGLALAESGGDHEFASFAENHRFNIPESALWEDVRAVTTNVGSALVRTFRQIEAANPDTLYGIFNKTGWTDKQKLPDATLIELIEHFSARPLTNAAVPPDVFGNAYEFLIKKFADLSNKKAGEYYTPRSVVKLMVDMLDPKEGESVYDPACGTGGMLIEVIEHVKAAGGRPQTLYGKLYGQEKVLTTSAIARMNLLLHGVSDFTIVREDTLRAPAMFQGDRLATFNCVIANPPFSLKKWGREGWSTDLWGRNALGGLPPEKYADWAWVQHMTTSMRPSTGRVAVVLPQGALFRGGAEQRIRQYFLDADLVEAVIGLAPNLFYGTNLAACIMVVRAKKPPERAGKVLIVDGKDLYRKGRSQNTLEPEHAEVLLDAYRRFTEVPHRAHVADLYEIRSHGFSLNVSLYVEKEAEEMPTLAQAVDDLRSANADAREARADLDAELAKWGW
jgi:type I restriction enzyme M protein